MQLYATINFNYDRIRPTHSSWNRCKARSCGPLASRSTKSGGQGHHIFCDNRKVNLPADAAATVRRIRERLVQINDYAESEEVALRASQDRVGGSVHAGSAHRRHRHQTSLASLFQVHPASVDSIPFYLPQFLMSLFFVTAHVFADGFAC